MEYPKKETDILYYSPLPENILKKCLCLKNAIITVIHVKFDK